MAFVHGRTADFEIDNSSGVLTDISAYCDNVDFPYAADMHEVTTFGDSAKEYIVGLKDGTISISGKWDSALDAILAPLVGRTSSSSFQYGPAGSTLTNVKYTGECFVTSYNVSSPVGDVVTFTCDMQLTGAITRGTY